MGARHAAPDDHHRPGWYAIRLQGHLAAHWAAWFDGQGLAHERDGTTSIHGLVGDQAARHDLLQRVRDVSLPLASVMPVAPDQPAVPTSAPR